MTGMMMAVIGGSGVRITFGDTNVSAVRASGSAMASIGFNPDGNIYIYDFAGGFSGRWTNSPATAALYEIRADYVSGVYPTGSLGTWNGLGVSQGWNMDQVGIGSRSGTIDIKIRQIGTTEILASGRVLIAASVG